MDDDPFDFEIPDQAIVPAWVWMVFLALAGVAAVWYAIKSPKDRRRRRRRRHRHR